MMTRSPILRLGWRVALTALTLTLLVPALGGRSNAGASPPAAPTNLQAWIIYDMALIDLSWQDNSDDEDYFVVESSATGRDGPWAEIAQLDADTTWYKAGGEHGARYWFRVAAANVDGTSDYSNIASATAVGPPDRFPAAKNLQAQVAHEALMIALSWEDNSDTEGYFLIERSTTGPGGPWDSIARVPQNVTTFNDTGLTYGLTYWYRVTGGNGGGYSNVVSATATSLPEPPLGDTNCDSAVTAVDASLVLQWNAAMIDSVPCLQMADVNQDGNVDPVDAALILQLVAGLTDGWG